MSQITIYLEEQMERKVRRSAKAEGISVSKWIARKIESGEKDEWPTHVLESFGTWNDVPEVSEIRAAYGKDARRAKLD